MIKIEQKTFFFKYLLGTVGDGWGRLVMADGLLRTVGDEGR
jgi:hypothetical protein